MAVSATETLTLRRSLASPTTERTPRSSSLCSPPPVPCTSDLPFHSIANMTCSSCVGSVTAVGGTQHFPEVAVSRFFSGGGFSNYVRAFVCARVLCLISRAVLAPRVPREGRGGLPFCPPQGHLQGSLQPVSPPIHPYLTQGSPKIHQQRRSRKPP